MLLNASLARMKIGLFGGSFDPVHLGHLLAARAAREEAGLDRIFFIPASQSPFKPDARPARATERLRWLRLAWPATPQRNSMTRKSGAADLPTRLTRCGTTRGSFPRRNCST